MSDIHVWFLTMTEYNYRHRSWTILKILVCLKIFHEKICTGRETTAIVFHGVFINNCILSVQYAAQYYNVVFALVLNMDSSKGVIFLPSCFAQRKT